MVGLGDLFGDRDHNPGNGNGGDLTDPDEPTEGIRLMQ